MPFTPLHMGPAATFKLFGQRYFSFTIFGFSQILMDLEPLFRILRDDDVLHGFSHSYLGATLIGLMAFLLGKPLCEYCLRIWNNGVPLEWLRTPCDISVGVAVFSGLLGTYSHVFFDSIMHADMRPWQPFSDSNGMLYWVSISELHLVFLALAGIGIVGLAVVWFWSKWTIEYD